MYIVNVGQKPTQAMQPVQSCFRKRTIPFLARYSAWVGQMAIHSPHWLQNSTTTASSNASGTVIRMADLSRSTTLKKVSAQVCSHNLQAVHSSGRTAKIFIVSFVSFQKSAVSWLSLSLVELVVG
jgi:hypothetical protein